MKTPIQTHNTIPHRMLGKSGLEVSEVGLGCWQLGGDFGEIASERANEVLSAADSADINFWDTADVYGVGLSEERISPWRARNGRQRIFASKVGRNDELYPNGYTYDAMRRSIENTLDRLKVSTLDLIQLHCIPEDILFDDKVWKWLDDFRTEGLIAHYGASVETVEQGLRIIELPNLASLQIIFNIFRQDAVQELLPQAQKNNVGIIVRLPLASGLLSGKFSQNTVFSESDHRNYNRNGAAFNVGETFSGLPYDKGLELVTELEQIIATETEVAGNSLATLAIRWCLDHPQISTVIAGASSATQVQNNAEATSLPNLPDALHDRLNHFYFERVKPWVRGSI